MVILPAKFLRGRLRLPGDKSISHRAAILAALADGKSRLTNFATGADSASTLRCLQQLGVDIEQNNAEVTIHGKGSDGLQQPNAPLDCGNSGTTVRLLAGVLAGQNFAAALTGDDSLRGRPMRRIIEPLRMMNVEIAGVSDCAPLTITGNPKLSVISYRLPVASAQVKSCLLLAGLYAAGRTEVVENVETRDHTERLLRWFGVDTTTIKTSVGEITERKISVVGRAGLRARDVEIPADISSAAFFIVAAACLPGSEIVLENLGVNPTRTKIIRVLKGFGVNIEVSNQRETNHEPLGDATVRGEGDLRRSGRDAQNVINGSDAAALIDELPILAVLGTQLANGLTVRDAAELRVKESDRIKVIVENLRLMNAGIEEYTDGFRVEQSELRGARVDSAGDHRIAMALAVAGLLARGETLINNAEAARISFPEFYAQLTSVIER